MVETAAEITSLGQDAAEKAQLIREFVDHAVTFTPDPLGLELVKSPEYLLREFFTRGEAFGDCDDVAVLAAALGMAVGIPARYTLLGFSLTDPFRHVLTELFTPCQGWVELDTTRPDQFPPGLKVVRWEHHGV